MIFISQEACALAPSLAVRFPRTSTLQKLGLFEEIVLYIRKNTKSSFYCSLEILCVGFYWIESFVEQLPVCETLLKNRSNFYYYWCNSIFDSNS